ncbi:MAG: hypothetical protein M1393_05150 [Candidatus Thermoplasmatota archaeon]|nr:hypothetical protein [Candidatus Thermoplasmatota archaeon]MDA8143113.1 hypothetical protein [Thermoplasmatales archaeon]
MAVKHHCIICSYLIYSGMYCSTCSAEIARARTSDDETLEEWLLRSRFSVTRSEFSHAVRTATLENFDKVWFKHDDRKFE